MFKKIRMLIMVISVVILFTGCNAKYNIEFNKDGYSDELYLYGINMSPFEAERVLGLNFSDENTDINYYNHEFINIDNQKTLRIFYNYDYDRNIKFGSLNVCYNNATFKITNDIILLDTDSKMECFKYLNENDTIEVNIKTDFKVIYNNADEVNGNTYTWLIDKNNLYKKISIKMDRNNLKGANNYLIIYIIGGVIFATIVIIFLTKILNKKNNKI